MIFALFTSFAWAQEVDYSVDIERFRPSTDPYGYVVTESAAIPKHLQWTVGLWGSYEDDPVILYVDGERFGGTVENGDGVVDNRSMVDLQTGFGVGKHFALGVDVPVLVWQEGFEPGAFDDPSIPEDLIAAGVGDIRVVPKVMALDLDKFPVGLAVIGEITVPLGATRSLIGEGGVSGMPMLALEFADGSVHRREYHIRFSMNAGYRFRRAATFRDVTLNDEFVYRAGLGLHFATAVEFGGELVGDFAANSQAGRNMEVLPWLKFLPHEMVTLTLGAGIGLLPGVGTPDYRLFLGATLGPSFNPADRDADRDGINNKVDLCKFEPEDMDGFQDADGCPDPDNDKDGILDPTDKCPLETEDLDGFQDEDGCPDNDNDKDGLADSVDRCPNEAENENGYQDDDGCPDEKPASDTDGDGYLDDADRCAFDPEDFDGWLDEDGCPDLDNDGDGIVDSRDRCPQDKETVNGFQDDDGCPDADTDGDGIGDLDDRCPEAKEIVNGVDDLDGCPDEAPVQRVVVEKERIRINDTILFELGKARIQPGSFELMDQIAQVIRDNPQIKRLRVEGHTDDVGNDVSNLRLSQARAESVVEYLVKAGVERERLDPVGFGEVRPLVPNTTTENRAANRRVEFLIVEQD